MKRVVLLLVPMLTWASCSPIFYAPSYQHVPLLSERGEFTASGSYVATESVEGLSLKTAYAVSSRWGLMAGGNLYFGEQSNDNAAHGRGGYFESGAGYFKKISNKVVFESYGLLGLGAMKNSFPQSAISYPGTDGKISANILLTALQPSIGFKSRYFEAALTGRAALLHYTSIRGNLMRQNTDQESVGNQQQYLSAHSNNFLIEPVLTLRGGLDFLKLEAQFGESINLSHPRFPQDGAWISIGLNYRYSNDRR